MKVTPELKAWLVENAGLSADASDDEARKSASEALTSGSLTVEKFTELTSVKKEVSVLESKLDAMLSSITKLAESKAKVETPAPPVKEEKQADEEKKAPSTSEWHQKLMQSFAGADPSGGEVRVKGAWEQYATTKSAAVYPEVNKNGKPHPMAGRPVVDFSERGRAIDNPSERDKAIAGAYAKLMILSSHRKSKSLGWMGLTEHEKELVHHAFENYKWYGASNGGDFTDIENRTLQPHEQKALIDDATSGGLEAAPIVFDDMVIQTPLLYGELYPLVNTMPLDRGRRVEGVATGTVTGSWGGVDATAISLFNTNSYVSAFDTTIYRWQGAFQIGLDFLSDTPIDFGALITAQYGERLLEDLDDVIADGNGTTQPEGIMQKAGATSVNFGGATSIGNYESLMFGVAKQEHRGINMASAVFCGSETSYSRARAIPVGASDARRIFGLDERSYTLFDRPYKINNTLTNQEVFYAVLAKYRMYRRRGLTIRTSTEGDTLMRNNEMLIVAHARFGGQLERGACAARTTTAPA